MILVAWKLMLSIHHGAQSPLGQTSCMSLIVCPFSGRQPRRSFIACQQVHKELLLKRRRHQEAHDAFKDLDDEPILRPKKPKEAEMPKEAGAPKEAEVDMVGQVLDNLRPPGPPQKQLRIRFKEVSSQLLCVLQHLSDHIKGLDITIVAASLMFLQQHKDPV